MVKRLDRTVVKSLNDEIIAALTPIMEAHGLTVKAEGARFSTVTCTYRLSVSVKDDSGQVQSPEVVAWNTLAETYGFPKEALGKQITRRGGSHAGVFVIAGLWPRSSKYPVLVKRVSDNKMFRFTAEEVGMLLGLDPTKVGLDRGTPIRGRRASW